MSFTLFSDILPQEECLAVTKNRMALQIGVPKESAWQERRIGLAPDDVAVLVAHGHRILIESGAGLHANFSDKDYSEAGAEITTDTKKVFSCAIVLKIEPPTLEEINYLQPKTVLISALQIKTMHKAYFELLAKKQITALAFEFIQDQKGNFPVFQSVSEIVGIGSVLIASELIADANHGAGVLFGNITGVPPIEVVVLGSDDIAVAAVKAAMGLGANVKVFDNSLTDLRNLNQKLNHSVFTSTLQPKILRKALMRCHVVIGVMRGENRSPVVVSEDMVQLMKKGAVIVDVSIDTGGCIETSQLTTLAAPTFVKHHVIHYCVPNIASRYARTASFSLSNILMPYLLKIGEEGGIENSLQTDYGLRNGLYFYHGVLTNATVSQWFDIPYKPVNLLFI
ncbi:alanine dehydrogenase [Capnocytophaga canimorsus]|uniref:alanine dehydrogenase n=1 Tax=Capnocytophaga canimorsus TaxID=28188 RepID=A0A250G0I2_9FLAO|nr:alanine dehydrogenase [Capnocytophaga canimorsus]ATA90902.1 alanine dehydrogenase [Capnocytophaga canimorsus]